MTMRTSRRLLVPALIAIALLATGCTADSDAAAGPVPPERENATAEAPDDSSAATVDVHTEHDAESAEHAPDAVADEEDAAIAQEAVEVLMVDIAFEPGALTVPAGADVELVVTNAGAIVHDLDLPEADLHVHTDPGESATATLRLDEPGRYEARCLIPGHAEAGMVLEVTAR